MNNNKNSANNKIINCIRIKNIINENTLSKYLCENYTREQLLEIKKLEFINNSNLISNNNKDNLSDLSADLSSLCPNLKRIKLRNTTDNISSLIFLTSITLEKVNITDYDFSVFENLKYLSIGECENILTLNIANDNIKNIMMYDTIINKITINCPELKTLYISECKLKNILLDNMQKLYLLSVKNNELEKINLEECPKLKGLDISRNKFCTLDDICGLFSLENLRALDIHANDIKISTAELFEQLPNINDLFIHKSQDKIQKKINICNKYDSHNDKNIFDCNYPDEIFDDESVENYYSGGEDPHESSGKESSGIESAEEYFR
jgi:hypothetical protein